MAKAPWLHKQGGVDLDAEVFGAALERDARARVRAR